MTKRINSEYEGCLEDNLVNVSLHPSPQDFTRNVSIPMTSFAQLLKIKNAVRETGHVAVERFQSSTINSSDYGSLNPSSPPTIDPTTTNNLNLNTSITPPSSSDPSNIPMSAYSICAILSTAYAYGCIMTTLFLLTLPIVCERIENETTQFKDYSYTISKSMALGGFAAIAGLTQLATPLVGMLSDECVLPNSKYEEMRAMGKRIPYLVLGTVLAVSGFAGQMYGSAPIHPFVLVSSDEVDDMDATAAAAAAGGDTQNGGIGGTVVYGGAWITYTIFFAIQNLGLNMVYTVMMALIPDLIPTSQTGVANGSLAMMVVTGSLFGFAMFHTVQENLMSMYKVYISVSLICGLMTYVFVLDREVFVRLEGRKNSRRLREMEGGVIPSLNHAVDTAVGTTDEVMIGDPSSSEYINAMEKTEDEELSVVPDAKGGCCNWCAKGGCCNYVLSLPRNSARTLYAMFYEPLSTKSMSEITSAYWIDTEKYRDFYIVTISRFFYYMGISSQTFFLYFIHDELREKTSDPESVVALLAIVGQTAGAITCYPVGILSDQYFECRRKPFVYMSCIMLAIGNLSLLLCTTLSQMIMVSVWLGAANGIYLTMDTSLAVDTIDEVDGEYTEVSTTATTSSHEKSDVTHNAAQMFGVWGVFGFLGSSLGPLTGGFALLFFGNMEPSSSTVTANGDDFAKFYGMAGYKALFSLCALYFLCSALSLTLVRKKSV